MPRLFWGLYHSTTRVWLTVDRAHTTDPANARRFGTYDNAERFLKIHAPEFAGAWKPEMIPGTFHRPVR